MNIDRDFAIQFRAWLFARQITSNGHPGSVEKNVSPGQILNILDCTRSLFHWARRPEVNQLPSIFFNPFTKDIVGEKVRKDPLRPVVFPLQWRIALIAFMDHWELCQLAVPLVLPLRCEDYAGLLISEVSFEDRLLRFGTRQGGRDFNKGRQSFVCPFPQELDPLLRACADSRPDGPLLRKRTVWEGRRRPRLTVVSSSDVSAHCENGIRDAKPTDVQTSQDLKRLVRSVLLDMGGASEDGLAKAFKSLVARSSLSMPVGARFYDLRGSCTTDLEQSGVSHLVQRYVTGHTTSDILFEYASIDPAGEMQKYFTHIQMLLAAIKRRALELGIANAKSGIV
jgi:integrase